MNYPGGKGSCFRQIINLIPQHKTYIETHFGGGCIFRKKKLAAKSYCIDINATVVDKHKSLATYDGSRQELLCMDAVAFLKDFKFTGDEFVYLDPPYVTSTRVAKNMYEFEMTDDQHRELLEVIKGLPCKVMISGYPSTMYYSLLADWHCTEIINLTRGGKVIERVWTNYDPAKIKMHDNRYYGENFRVRERIKRKTQRWKKRLKNMDAVEREIILEALLDTELTEASP